MTYRVEVTARAARDPGNIYERINAEESVAAAKWFDGLEKAIYVLGELPRRCPMAPESKRTKRSLRHLLYGNKPHIYRVIYEIDEKARVVWVITIRHGAREPLSRDELS
jgi:plasmid stabilization system protein ParE